MLQILGFILYQTNKTSLVTINFLLIFIIWDTLEGRRSSLFSWAERDWAEEHERSFLIGSVMHGFGHQGLGDVR